MDTKLNTFNDNKSSAIFAINKPVGLTSHDVVNRIRTASGIRRVGHAGALDPFASGVLIILIGSATKKQPEFLHSEKEYRAKIVPGVVTDTLDTEGAVERINYFKPENIKNIDRIIRNFKEQYVQTVPVFSSVKVNGERLRVLARRSVNIKVKGGNARFTLKSGAEKTVQLPKRDVSISALTVEGVEQTNDLKGFEVSPARGVDIDSFTIITLKIKVSKGFYVRSFAQDFSNALQKDVGGSLLSLERTASGEIALDDCLSLEHAETMVLSTAKKDDI